VTEKHTITIHVEGGLIQEIQDIPDTIRIEVRDYDVEGSIDDNLITDENGYEFFQNIWEHDHMPAVSNDSPCEGVHLRNE